MRRLFLILTLLSVSGWSQPSAQQPAQPPIVVKVEMPPPPPRDSLGYLQALGPLIAASVALFVGLVQCYLQWKNFRQNLFDRRFKVYSAVEAYFTLLLQTDGRTDTAAFMQFRRDTDPAEFLFDKEVFKYIDEGARLSMQLKSAQSERAHYATIATSGLDDASLPVSDLLDKLRTKVPSDASARVVDLERQINAMRFKVTQGVSGGVRDAFRDYLELQQNWFILLVRTITRQYRKITRWMEQQEERLD